MLTAQNIAAEFSARPLFAGATFTIMPGDRIALTGKNGAGKSTLLKILSQQLTPTEGTLTISRGTTIGYLPQVMNLSDTTTLREETEKAFAEAFKAEERLAHLTRELEQRTDYESPDYALLAQQFAHETERYHTFGAANREADLERTLRGLGFKQTDLDRPTSEFSGGWRMRIELAKILLQKPDILLLDEPTNHLDIESIRWLETFLARGSMAVVIVSHDRAFINNTANRTLEISCHRITDYRVKYDEYVRLRAERREAQLRAYENQQKEIAEIKDFIERFRYKPTKAVQVQSRIKQLEKIVPIEVDEVDRSSLRLKFPPAQRSGDFPVTCDGVGKAYGDHVVLRDVNLTIRRGEKVAFVGKNGEGKSTLVKCIMGEIPFTGTLKIGHNAEIAYYAQNQAQLLDGELTVFDTIDRVAKGDVRLRIRDLLGAFMFGGEASDKKVKVLSGGERSRLAMLRLLLDPANVLILDEPTNHLDLRTKDVLKEAILAFDGTVIIVSHDRDFLDGLVTKVYEFGGGTVREHIGGIYDYLRWKEQTASGSLSQSPSATTEKQTAGAPSAPTEGKLSYEARKEQARQRRRLEREAEQREQELMALEEKKSELESKLATPEGAADQDLFTAYAALQGQIAEAEEAWTTAVEALENFGAEGFR